MRAIICDVDGTVADCRHRLHHVLPGSKRDWDAFFSKMADDEPIWPVIDMIRALSRSYAIIMCSSRPEKYRAVTEEWFRSAGVYYYALYMRPDDDTRPDHIVKAQILRGIREDGYEVALVIDDRQSVVDMWRDQGLVCLQAAPAELEIPASASLTLMVGPSGAGKTTWVRENYNPAHVISSDQVREDLCGDFRCQDRNTEVFAAVHAVARARLKAGLPVVIDATHIRRKDRMASAALAGNAPVHYVVIDRPILEKRATGAWRNDIPGFDLIGAHAQTFASNLKDILAGDGLPNVIVYDVRNWRSEERAAA